MTNWMNVFETLKSTHRVADYLQRHLKGYRQNALGRVTDLDNINAALETAMRIAREEVTAWHPLSKAPRDGTLLELRGESGMSSSPHRVMYARYEKGREGSPLQNPELGYDEWAWRTVQGDHCVDDGAMPTEWRHIT